MTRLKILRARKQVKPFSSPDALPLSVISKLCVGASFLEARKISCYNDILFLLLIPRVLTVSIIVRLQKPTKANTVSNG